MGGNALKNCFTRRYSNIEYNNIKNEVLTKLNSIPSIIQANTPENYKYKKDFGDLDIVITFISKLDLREVIKNNFETKEIVSNGDCISFEYKEFQIDLIKSSEKYFKTTLTYLSYNDLGNLIGRIAHKFGLKYGHKGLLYILKNEDGYMPEEVFICDNNIRILEFLGFDPFVYSSGFNKLEDIFNFVINSTYFDPDIFSYENMNHTNRVRNKKRTTYERFLEYIKDLPSKKINFSIDKTVYHSFINYKFPEVDIFSKIEKYKNKLALNSKVKEKFNGKIISEITGLSGEDLGKYKKTLINSL